MPGLMAWCLEDWCEVAKMSPDIPGDLIMCIRSFIIKIKLHVHLAYCKRDAHPSIFEKH